MKVRGRQNQKVGGGSRESGRHGTAIPCKTALTERVARPQKRDGLVVAVPHLDIAAPDDEQPFERVAEAIDRLPGREAPRLHPRGQSRPVLGQKVAVRVQPVEKSVDIVGHG